MSVWTQVTGSFYIYDFQDEMETRLKSFMRDNYDRLPCGSERGLAYGVTVSDLVTEGTFGDGEKQEIHGACQLHIFGSLRDKSVEMCKEKMDDFVRVLVSAYPVRIGQVLMYDGFGDIYNRKIFEG